jgi:hypothetical protein
LVHKEKKIRQGASLNHKGNQYGRNVSLEKRPMPKGMPYGKILIILPEVFILGDI